MNIENTTINANDLINDLVNEIFERRLEIDLMEDSIVKKVTIAEHAVMTYMIDRVLSKHLEKSQHGVFLGRLQNPFPYLTEVYNTKR